VSSCLTSYFRLYILVYPCYIFFFIVDTGKYPLFLCWIHGTPSTT
jgi:hypothetical protein